MDKLGPKAAALVCLVSTAQITMVAMRTLTDRPLPVGRRGRPLAATAHHPHRFHVDIVSCIVPIARRIEGAQDERLLDSKWMRAAARGTLHVTKVEPRRDDSWLKRDAFGRVRVTGVPVIDHDSVGVQLVDAVRADADRRTSFYSAVPRGPCRIVRTSW